MAKMGDNNSDIREWLKHILDEVKSVRDDQKEIVEEQRSMGKTLTENTISLEEHIRRTALLEEVVAEIRRDRKEAISEYDDRLKPLEKQQIFISAYWKLALIVVSVLTSEAFVAAWKIVSEMVQHVK